MNEKLFKLCVDKPTHFEYNLEIEGASLTNTMARLVVETQDRTLLFTKTRYIQLTEAKISNPSNSTLRVVVRGVSIKQ